MATVPDTATREELAYPTSDGLPMAETDWHRNLMIALIETLRGYYADEPNVYVTGNLILCYEPGDRRRHISPDVFVVKGVPKHDRPNYLIWQEGKSPDLVIELTSQSTREEDVEDKFQLYRDTLRVPEYFLFDPLGDYLRPRLQGYRLQDGRYAPIGLIHGRMPSQVLGLHLGVQVDALRLYNPATGQYLLTGAEQVEALRRETERLQANNEELAARAKMAEALQQVVTSLQATEADNQRLRREMDELRQQMNELRRSVQRQ